MDLWMFLSKWLIFLIWKIYEKEKMFQSSDMWNSDVYDYRLRVFVMDTIGLGGLLKDSINGYEGEGSNLFCDDHGFFTYIVI